MSDSLRPHESQHTRPPSLSPTLEFTQTHVHRVGDAIRPSHPLSSPSPHAPNPFQHQGLFQWVNFRVRGTKYWNFSFSISLSNEQPGLISFRMDWLELLAGQGTLKSLLQLCSSKASILRHSAFFTVQLSHPNMTTGKTMAVNSLMFKLVLEKAEEPEIKLPTSAGSWKKQESSKKNLLLLYCLCQSLWLCGSQETVENSGRDGNTRLPNLPLEKPVCRSGSNS